MKLNKNYQSSTQLPSKAQKADAFFPVFLPSYEKINGKSATQLLQLSLERKRKAQQLGKNILPFLFSSTRMDGSSKLLASKTQLPPSAKRHRLAIHKQKLLKKQISLLSQLFSCSQLEQYDFNLYHPEFQKLLTWIEEKKLRKWSQELVWRDVSTQTIVAPEDIERREEKQLQLEVKCFVETKNDVFPLVVTDPMLLFSDVGVVVHENDKRYKKHLGKKIIIPVINKSIPIFGASGIDTVKDNGIQRLNPLLSPEHLEKVKTYQLPIDEQFIDEEGKFTDQLVHFAGKSVFDFTTNIVETLNTIWNLLSQQEILQKVPYSKETGQRLIRRVLPMAVIDLCPEQSAFSVWLAEHFPEQFEEFQNLLSSPLIIESKNPYAAQLFFLKTGENLKLFRYSDYQGQFPEALAFVLLYALMRGDLASEFSLEEWIDVLFLLPDEDRSSLATLTGFSAEELRVLSQELKCLDADVLVEKLQTLLQNLPWIQEKGTQYFVFHPEILWWKQELIRCACNASFLEVWALLTLDQKFFLQSENKSPNMLLTLLFLLFLSGQEGKISLLPFWKEEVERPILPDKFTKLVESYGRESLRLTWAQQQKCEEAKVQASFDYLKHLRNLFKTLYEQAAFPFELPEQLRLAGKEYWILAQWWEFEGHFAELELGSAEFSVQIQVLQKFTRAQFSWYLALSKQEKNPESFLVAGQIFLALLDLLKPIIPEFFAMVVAAFTAQMPPRLSKEAWSGVKDYKIHLLFDILQGISSKKSELQLKKHLPIELAVQANPEILRMLETHQASLKLLFKTQEIHYLTANEVFPSGFETFSILDIQVGIKALLASPKEDAFAELERAFKAKSQTLEYVRSTLMALSLNPLSDPVKLSEKEEELEQLKTDLQILEIKIQKAKMEKKG